MCESLMCTLPIGQEGMPMCVFLKIESGKCSSNVFQQCEDFVQQALICLDETRLIEWDNGQKDLRRDGPDHT